MNETSSSVTVQRMPRHRTATKRRPTRAQRETLRRRGVRRREHRVRRFALLSLVAIVAVVTLALTAFDGSTTTRVSALAPAPAQRLLPATTPQPLVIAKLGDLRLQLPISPSRLTAIGYHAAGDGSLALQPTTILAYPIEIPASCIARSVTIRPAVGRATTGEVGLYLDITRS